MKYSRIQLCKLFLLYMKKSSQQSFLGWEYKIWDFDDVDFSNIGDQRKTSWGAEVEPPEDVQTALYDTDPDMILKNSELYKRPLEPEEDMDKLYHPLVTNLLKIQIQNLDTPVSLEIQVEPLKEDVKYSQEPEEDMDDIYHPDFSKLMPEEHPDNQAVQLEPPRHENRIHLQPEEDMDDLYHKDASMLIAYHDDAKAAPPVVYPSQRKHSEPEEDMDGLYHQ